MSVHFHVRRLSPKSVNAVRADPALTILLCDSTYDFDPAKYEHEMLQAVPPHRVDAARASFVTRRDRQLVAQKELISALEAGGIACEDVGAGLHLEQSWWGMEAMIGSKPGTRVVVEDEGEAIGDDVGYGPARLLSPTELPPVVASLDLLSREAAEPRFRVREEHDAAEKRSMQPGGPSRLTAEEFEKFAWRPLCALRDYLRETTASGAWLLKWFD
jgi:hypothetical protein